MKLQAVNPWRRQALYILQPSDGVAHRIYGHVFGVLVLDIFAIGGLEGLFPVLPGGVREPRTPTDHFGEYFLFSYVREVPVQFPCQRQPLSAVEHRILREQISETS